MTDLVSVLAQMDRDHRLLGEDYTLVAKTEDYLAEVFPLLEPYLGPVETWTSGLVAGAGGPLAGVVTLLVEKALVAGVGKWAAARRAKENS